MHREARLRHRQRRPARPARSGHRTRPRAAAVSRPDEAALLHLQATAGNSATAQLVTQTSPAVIQRSLLRNLKTGIVRGLHALLSYFTRANQAPAAAPEQPTPAAEEQAAPVPAAEQQPTPTEGREDAQTAEPAKPGKGKLMWANLAGDWQRMQRGDTTQTKVGATLARRMGGTSDDLWDELQKVKKNGEQYPGQKTEIELELAKAQKRAKKFQNLIGGPETFMLKGEIEDHLGAFKDGAHAFITGWHHGNFKGEWGGWGRKGDRNFVAPLDDANALVEKAKAEEGIRTLEEQLGIPPWSWVNNCPDKTIYRYIIPPGRLEDAGLEMARGVEGGAYAKEWVAGGLTMFKQRPDGGWLGGLKEAVIKTFQGEDFELAEKNGIVKIEALKLPSTPDAPKTE